jgi:uncharacterized protein (TIGR03435 family)
MRLSIWVMSITLAATIPTPSQVPGTAKPSFEVATIKRNTAVLGGSRQGEQPGGRFSASRVTLRSLIGFAHYPGGGNVLSGPSWMDSDLWDAEAKAADGSVQPRPRLIDLNAPAGTIQLMVQSLLEDRFQLKLHSETRELPVYELIFAKGGPKAKLAEDQSPPMLPEPGAKADWRSFTRPALEVGGWPNRISRLILESRAVFTHQSAEGRALLALPWRVSSLYNLCHEIIKHGLLLLIRGKFQ